MNKYFSNLCLLGLVLITTPALSKVMGNTSEFTSPRGIKEQCIALKHIPGGVYSEKDHQIETNYCLMDIYSNTGMCPKTWSTSPGTMFYKLNSTQYSAIKQFEFSSCHNQRKIPIKAIAFKNTINMKDTSGTFSTSSLLYYHFSRYLNTQIKVPVAVYRSLDKNIHRSRVTHRGLAYTHKGLIHNAWKDMMLVEDNPAAYHPVSELFTADQQQIYGVLLRSTGKRYSAVMNGSRQSGWGQGQNRDFTETPAFLALRSHKPLKHAIPEAITKARRNHILSKAMGHDLSKEQVAFWMQDITEITLLDYIFSQQDRIGNIDYTKLWISSDKGQLQRHMNKPASVQKQLQIKQTHLNDNDAGGRYSYSNFTKTTGMLEKIVHYNTETYQKLMHLDKDFSQHGQLYQYLSETFGLSNKQKGMIVKNTQMAAEILRKHCRSGQLVFDLNPGQFFLHGFVKPFKQACDL